MKTKQGVSASVVCGLVMIWMLCAARGAAAVDFQADVIQTMQGMEVTGTFYLQGNNSRTEMNIMGRNTCTISRLDKKIMWMVHPDEGFYIEMPLDPASPQSLRDEAAFAKVARKKKVGSETVNGFACDKFEITYNDPGVGVMTTWISKKLDFPVRTIFRGPMGEVHTEYKNIRTGAIDASLFELPAGLQKMSMPTMGGMPPSQ